MDTCKEALWMGKIIGIDIGGSTTKIVGFDKGKIFSPYWLRPLIRSLRFMALLENFWTLTVWN